jgi:hypothetical protein
MLVVSACLCSSMVWFGLVWFGLVWFGLVWFGLVWFGLVWFGLVWFGLVWFGLVGVVVDGSEDVHNGPGVVVGFCSHFGFCRSKGLRSGGSIVAVK